MQMSWGNMQIRRMLLFFFPWRSNYREWLRAVCSALCPPRSLSVSSSLSLLPSSPPPPAPKYPPCSFQMPSSLCSTLFFPPIFFFKVHPPVAGFQLQLLLVSLLSEKSTSLEASYQNLLQQGGRLKLSGMTCGLRGAGGGDKCMANLWNI